MKINVMIDNSLCNNSVMYLYRRKAGCGVRVINFNPDSMEHIKLLNKAIKDVTFYDFEDRLFILKACDFSVDTLKDWFNNIGIKYDDIKIEGRNMLYTVGGNALYLTDLSHVEKYLLYIIAMGKYGLPLVVNGITDFMGYRSKKILANIAKDYDNLTIINYHSALWDLKEYLV